MDYRGIEIFHVFNDLNPWSVIRKDFDFSNRLDFVDGFSIRALPCQEVLTESFIAKGQDIGLIKYVFLTGNYPNVIKNSIHQDIENFEKRNLRLFAFNINIQGQGQFQWYDPKTPGEYHEYLGKFAKDQNVNLIRWLDKENWGDPIAIWDRGAAAMVRTDYAHTVFNENADEVRYSVSIRFNTQIGWQGFKNWVYQQKDLFLPT